MSKKECLPADIEARSFSIIAKELEEMGITLPDDTAFITKRVIHTTADFSYVEQLVYQNDPVSHAVQALKSGAWIVTDTKMAKAGVSKTFLSSLGGQVVCYMADEDVARDAKARGTTRAAASMRKAAKEHPNAIFAVGNAPTALMELKRIWENDPAFRPALVIGVPVGFVNVIESKDTLLETDLPAIVARGRKGGSNVAAAICNALIYAAAGRLKPHERGGVWTGETKAE